MLSRTLLEMIRVYVKATNDRKVCVVVPVAIMCCPCYASMVQQSQIPTLCVELL